MTRVFTITIVVCWSMYWAVTLIFISPNNYISLSLSDENETFQTFLFQRWNFFAPPPTYDDRLYYTFSYKTDTSKIQTFEVIERLNQKNTEKSVLNWETDILDYILSNSMSSLAESVNEINEIRQYEKQDAQTISDTLYVRLKDELISTSPQFITLKNYAKSVAHSNGLTISEYDIIITLSRRPLPKFYQRYDNTSPKEEIFYRSSRLQL
jgi:hypothetical protein